MVFDHLAEYGVAMVSLALLGYVIAKWIENKQQLYQEDFSQVIQNNTKALQDVSSAVNSLQICLAQQDCKVDELLERARSAARN